MPYFVVQLLAVIDLHLAHKARHIIFACPKGQQKLERQINSREKGLLRIAV